MSWVGWRQRGGGSGGYTQGFGEDDAVPRAGWDRADCRDDLLPQVTVLRRQADVRLVAARHAAAAQRTRTSKIGSAQVTRTRARGSRCSQAAAVAVSVFQLIGYADEAILKVPVPKIIEPISTSWVIPAV